MKVYLGGPINGCTDDEAHGWRDKFRALLANRGDIEFVDPMTRDYRGREDECVEEIVTLDLQDIDECDAILAYCWQASWGTGMEIHYSHARGKRVVVVIPDGMRVSPWLRYHATVIVSTLEEAAELL